METRASRLDISPGAGSNRSAKSDHAEQTSSAFSLLLNPFILLGVSPNATAQDIKHAYEDAIEDGIATADVLRRAQQELLAPRLRVYAEVSGFLDVAPELVSRLIFKLRAGAARTELDSLVTSLHALPRSNVLAHLASQSSVITEDNLAELLEAQSAITAGAVCEAISDARSAAACAKINFHFCSASAFRSRGTSS